MSPNETIRLLILNDSRSEAERLISMLHNAGKPSRAQHVESEEVLTKLLDEQNWDLLIAHDQTQSVSPQAAVRQIKRLNKDLPVVLLTEEPGSKAVVDGLKLGARDVVPLDEDQHLLLVIDRELANNQERRQRRNADRRFKESEQRAQQLLDSSRDAIAYVHDGLIQYANESFAERFGYEDRDEVEFQSLLDMVSPGDSDKVKSFLKQFSLKGEDASASELSFTAVGQGGSEQPITVAVANAIYDDEPCIQFLMRGGKASAPQLEQQIETIAAQDVATGLFNRQHLLGELNKLVKHAASNEVTHAVLFIDADLPQALRSDLGTSGIDALLADLGLYLHKQVREEDTLGRFGDESFMLLMPSTGGTQALDTAQQLVAKIEDHICDAEGKTVQVTASIGVSLVNDTVTDADTAIDFAQRAMEAVRAAGKDGIGNGAQLYEPEEPKADTDSKTGALQMVQKALDENRFKLLFQPIISLRGDEEEHYEVLLRLLNDDNEEVSPDKFLDAAKEAGASTKIDRWVILESIKTLAAHRAKGNKTRMIINLTPQSIVDDSLLAWLKVVFKSAKLPANSVIFQVSEHDVTSQLKAAKTFGEGLKELGGTACISHFGCALNPFNTFKHFDVEYVKVDGSFTLEIQKNNENPETLTNLIKQLQQEKKVTIVPFVENASVLSTLWQAGVHYIQGHYLQEPSASMDYDFSMDG